MSSINSFLFETTSKSGKFSIFNDSCLILSFSLCSCSLLFIKGDSLSDLNELKRTFFSSLSFLELLFCGGISSTYTENLEFDLKILLILLYTIVVY